MYLDICDRLYYDQLYTSTIVFYLEISFWSFASVTQEGTITLNSCPVQGKGKGDFMFLCCHSEIFSCRWQNGRMVV